MTDTETTATLASPGPQVGGLRATWDRLRRYPGILVGGFIIVGLVLAGFFAPLPYDPIEPNVFEILNAPSAAHWFGTDVIGFDIFSRTIDAAQRDIPLALIGALASLVIGVPLGLVASAKGKAGERIMRALDVFQAFPLIVLSVALVTVTGNELRNVVFAILIINVPRFMRLVRSEALSLRESRFMEAAEAMGCSRARMMFRHMLPNVVGITMVQTSLATAHALIVIASLSFLGIGVTPPDASWGAMIQAGARQMATGEWWVVTFPGLGVLLAVASFNMVADSLDAFFDRSGR